MLGRRHLVLSFVLAGILAVMLCGCGPSAAPGQSSASPSPSTDAPASPAWVPTSQLTYPDETLVTNDAGSRSFPFRDITVASGGLDLLDACDRHAVLVDEGRSQLRLVDLRRGTSRLVLASPVSLQHQPSAWARTQAALERRYGGPRDYLTQIGAAQVSHEWLVWEEDLWDNSAGAAVVAAAVYAAPIADGLATGPAKLVAVSGMKNKSAYYGLDFTLEGGRVIVGTGAGTFSGKGFAVRLIDLRTGRRTTLAQSKQSSGVHSTMAGERAFVLFERDKGDSQGLLLDLSEDTLPVDVLLIPHTSYSQDLRSLTLSRDGSLAWAVTDDLNYGGSEVLLLSPGGAISRVTNAGLGPAFLGDWLFWLVASESGGRSLAGLDPGTDESFAVMGSDSPKRWTWQVYGSGHTLVLPLKDGKASTTLRVFDVSQT